MQEHFRESKQEHTPAAEAIPLPLLEADDPLDPASAAAPEGFILCGPSTSSVFIQMYFTIHYGHFKTLDLYYQCSPAGRFPMLETPSRRSSYQDK